MRLVLLSILLLQLSNALAQTAKVKELPAVVFIPQAADSYHWERVMHLKGRVLFTNEIACTDSDMYSFGGFNTVRILHEMNRLEDGHLVTDSISYPGQGFSRNLFFIHDSLLYLGGGHDSNASRYAFNDFWQYNLHTHAWKRLADLPFYYRHSLNAFREGTKEIVLVPQLQGDSFRYATPVFYEYDTENNSWHQISKELNISNLPTGGGEEIANNGLTLAAFRIEDNIYVFIQKWCPQSWTCGNSFYKFNIPARTWKELPPFPGNTISLGMAFALSDNRYGYLGGGIDLDKGGNSRLVFRYNPFAEKWERINDMPRGVHWAKGWTFKGDKYVGFGINDKYGTVDVWRLTQKR